MVTKTTFCRFVLGEFLAFFSLVDEILNDKSGKRPEAFSLLSGISSRTVFSGNPAVGAGKIGLNSSLSLLNVNYI
jgi:hypothetical protein